MNNTLPQKTTNIVLAVASAQAVFEAESLADKIRPNYLDAKKAYETARDALNVENRKVFEARSVYLKDLIKEVVKSNDDLLEKSLFGEPPFVLVMFPERMTFQLNVTGLDPIHKFGNVESYLLDLLN